MENMYSVLITAITVLGGASAFRYYEKRAQKKEKDDEFIKHDCKDRISKLEGTKIIRNQNLHLENMQYMNQKKVTNLIFPISKV
jgi:hypothetical protein